MMQIGAVSNTNFGNKYNVAIKQENIAKKVINVNANKKPSFLSRQLIKFFDFLSEFDFNKV